MTCADACEIAAFIRRSAAWEKKNYRIYTDLARKLPDYKESMEYVMLAHDAGQRLMAYRTLMTEFGIDEKGTEGTEGQGE